MKHLFIMLIVLPCMLSAKALLRETSPRQNRLQPVPDKELVFARGESSSVVSAYLGIDGGTAQVIDPAAIRLARATPFSMEELYIDDTDATTVEVDGKVAYNGTVIFTHLQKEAIGRVESVQHQLVGSIFPTSNDMAVTIDGFTATVVIDGDGPGLFLTVYPAVPDTSVDLTKEDVTITDTLGSVRLSEVRQSVIDHFTSNTGADWWRYPARGTVNLNSHLLSFGHETGSAISGAVGSVHLYAGGVPAISAMATGSSGEVTSGTINATDIAVTDTAVTITATCNGIDPADVRVEWSAALTDAEWLTVADERTVADSVITLTVPRTSGAPSGFYRLVAGEEVSVVVTIAGDLDVTGGIILTSPGGKRFRVTVADDGTLTTTEITE